MNKCRFCGTKLSVTFVNLGVTPLCQTHIAPEQLGDMEPFFPLHARVCEACYLVQLDEFVTPSEIFEEYAYFSSYSDSWLDHAARFCKYAADRFELTDNSFVVEIASNDGYLLKNFVEIGVPCLGVEPAANVADAAREKGVPTVSRFFGVETAEALKRENSVADLIVGNNVLAHVPDLNDFVAGMKILLAPTGVISMEFPHLGRLMAETQFDTIYHEHFSYFSFLTVSKVFAHHGLQIFDVEELSTHGGSLRIFARHAGKDTKTSDRAEDLLVRERKDGFDQIETYQQFQDDVDRIKHELLAFLIAKKREGKNIVGYGAPGKGNTLLNYCGIGPDILDYTVDRNPYKQGKYTPGMRIPIDDPSRIRETKPDYVLILPWNLSTEITADFADISEWGGRFVVPIPAVRTLDPAR